MLTLSVASTLAPCARSIRITSMLPCAAAISSAVAPSCAVAMRQRHEALNPRERSPQPPPALARDPTTVHKRCATLAPCRLCAGIALATLRGVEARRAGLLSPSSGERHHEQRAPVRKHACSRSLQPPCRRHGPRARARRQRAPIVRRCGVPLSPAADTKHPQPRFARPALASHGSTGPGWQPRRQAMPGWRAPRSRSRPSQQERPRPASVALRLHCPLLLRRAANTPSRRRSCASWT